MIFSGGGSGGWGSETETQILDFGKIPFLEWLLSICFIINC